MTQSKNLNINEIDYQKIYKYPLIMLGIYVTLLLITVVLANRLMLLYHFLEPGGILFFPLAFPILNIVGDVYGYSYSRLFIWIGAICELFFASAVVFVAHLPHPAFFQHVEAYQTVLDPTIRFVFSTIMGTIIGELLNIYILAKWKILFQGRNFILRSLGATAIGQAGLTIVVDILAFSGKLSTNNLLWMMVCGFSAKMFFTILFIFPSWIIVKKLKEKEKVDYFDINTNFNPFRLEIENEGNQYSSSI